jgi:ATP-dependent Lon protease
LHGYTLDEKLKIARKYLLPKQICSHGLEGQKINLNDRLLEKIIMDYTREAGVRNLEREIGSICRYLAVEYSEAVDNQQQSYFKGDVTEERVRDILGNSKFFNDIALRESIPGVITGLAWTSTGTGDILFIEVSEAPGKGNLKLTGSIL